jgi:arylsulfatase A-like enzyme
VNTRIPLAIVFTDIEPKRINEAVSSLDIMPTIIDLAGGMVPLNIEGLNLMPLIKGQSLNRDIYTERQPYDEYAVRRGSWKYILRNPGKKNKEIIDAPNYDQFMRRMVVNDVDAGDELYDLSNDPSEQMNLVGRGLPIEDELRSAAETFKGKMTLARLRNRDITNVVPTGGLLIPYP